MRCLYCGKHLPLLRKLRGGGEFCSDAHRDNYHEEYNRLAVSRLLQAQSRTEEAQPSTSAAPETPEATVVVAEEPEIKEISSSIIEEFKIPQIRPVVARTQFEMEVDPVFPPAAEPAYHSYLPATQPPSFAPRVEVASLASRAGSRRIATAVAEIGPPSVQTVEQVLPLPSGIRFADRQPAEAGALALPPPSTLRSTRIELLELGVSAVEFTKPKPALPAISSVAQDLGLPRAGSLQLVVSSTGVEGSTLEIGFLVDFPDLVKLRPTFDLRMKLLEASESVPPEPVNQAANGRAEVVPITPRRALEALAQLQADRKREEPQEPPLNRTLKPIDIPAVAPVTEVLTDGLDSIQFAAQPRLLHYNTQPLRPKMAVGTAAGPLPARSGPVENAAESKAYSNGDNNATSKMMPRSMLHLDGEAEPADSDTEEPWLIGKLGGLFGKKSRTRKQEAGSGKSEVKRRNEVMRS